MFFQAGEWTVETGLPRLVERISPYEWRSYTKRELQQLEIDQLAEEELADEIERSRAEAWEEREERSMTEFYFVDGVQM